MNALRWRRTTAGAAFACLILGGAIVPPKPVHAQRSVPQGEWPTYGGDVASTRYSPLDQINAGNFDQLDVAWRFKTDALGPRPEFNLQATPLMAGGRLFTTAGTRRAAVALDAATGELLWMHSLNEGERTAAALRMTSGRGLAYWTDGEDERILYTTIGYQMVALDARTGVPVAGFGRGGIVDLKSDADQPIDLLKGDIVLNAAPIIAKGVVVIAAAPASSGGSPRGRTNIKGYVRAYDVRTGKRLWTFHTIPLPGEFGNDTWLNDSWSYTGHAGVWTQMTIDEELGTVYLPTEIPTGDFYGGYRHGAGLFGESLVALDLQTGKRKWHYQFVHHGVWDMDLPCAPILADITVNGRAIKAVAQPTKQGWLYVFDRITGQPVWPIEERPVEKGNVPGEWYSPTQPFVTKPPPFDVQGVTTDDLIDYTPELRAEALQVVSRYKMGPIFTPPVVSTWPSPLGTLMLPSFTGGGSWPGGSFDPETKRLYIFSNTAVTSVGLVPGTPERNGDFGWVWGQAREPLPPGAAPGAGAGEGDRSLTVQGLPITKPPYGRITAFDLNKGDILWQIPHGETPDNVKKHPALKGVNVPRTGRPGRVGVLTTKTLVIAGEGGFFTTPSGRRGAMLRAYDKATGADVGAVEMPAPQTGSLMTYLWQGKQYITVPISGPGYSGEFLTFRLPGR